jgi:hypothetical protein
LIEQLLRTFPILFDAVASCVDDGKPNHRRWVACVGGEFVPLQRLGNVLGYSPAAALYAPRLYIALE